MESTINAMLKHALNAIEANTNIKETVKQELKVQGIYESYLSQFGPMVVQMEMASTIAVFYNNKGGSKGDRKEIVKLLYAVIESYDSNELHGKRPADAWAKYLMENQITFTQEELILDASIALKRAIRTFPLTEKNDQD
jgi:CRISPR/Cas system CMR-associated protein Cmr5 small subunit